MKKFVTEAKSLSNLICKVVSSRIGGGIVNKQNEKYLIAVFSGILSVLSGGACIYVYVSLDGYFDRSGFVGSFKL